MKVPMTAIELTGTIDKNQQLQLDEPLPIAGPARIRLIILYPLEETWDEHEWLQTAANNPAFAFLQEPEEDIYALTDGQPFHDEV
ncbi:MAG: hypothetical protein KDE56_28530 [Anaerolineales bacterium]|nr:hypothetical protein [Anaerolineales bacterium]